VIQESGLVGCEAPVTFCFVALIGHPIRNRIC